MKRIGSLRAAALVCMHSPGFLRSPTHPETLNARADRFLTAGSKGHFSAIDLPEEKVPVGSFLLATRRGKRFNSLIHGKIDPLTGAHRDSIFISQEDAERLRLKEGDPIRLRTDRGEFRGRVKIDRIKPGCVQGHWPELNVLVAAGCLDPSGVPDYNAVVQVVSER